MKNSRHLDFLFRTKLPLINLIALSFIALATSCAASNQSISNAKLKTLISEKYTGFREAMETKDPAFFERLYTQDAVFYHVGYNTVGDLDISRDFAKMMENDVVISCQPVDVEVYGNAAFEIGKATVKKSGETIAHERYIVIWKNVNGDWKIDKDVPIKVE